MAFSIIKSGARITLWGLALPAALLLSLLRVHCDIARYAEAFQPLARFSCSLDQQYDKHLHVLAFIMLTLLLAIAYPRLSRWRLIVFLVLLGCGTELLQMLPGIERSADWGDLAYNLLGIAGAMSVVVAVRAFRHR